MYGGDLSLQPFSFLRVEGDFAESQWRGTNAATGQYDDTGNDSTTDRQAWDGRVIVPFGKLELSGQYKKVGAGFDAPGNWGKIGRWANPTAIEGYGGGLRLPIGKSLAVEGSGNFYQIIGNVWEWCLDGFDKDFYRLSPAQDPVRLDSPSGMRVLRGGAFDQAAESARSARRHREPPTFKSDSIGVRPARALER